MAAARRTLPSDYTAPLTLQAKAIRSRAVTKKLYQYKLNLNAQSLRLFGLHDDVNEAHRAGANRFHNKNKKTFTQSITFIRVLQIHATCSGTARGNSAMFCGFFFVV